VQIKKLERKLIAETDDLQRNLITIEIEKKSFKALTMERIAHDRIREIKEWNSVMNTLIPHMKFGLEDVNRHQAESFPIRFERQAKTVTDHTQPADAINLLGLDRTAKRVLGGK